MKGHYPGIILLLTLYSFFYSVNQTGNSLPNKKLHPGGLPGLENKALSQIQQSENGNELGIMCIH